MERLENKIPPPLLWVAATVVTFAVDRADLDGSPLESPLADWLGLAVALVGVGVAAAGLKRFAALATTVDPHHIDGATTLATDGIYGLTRNPMYVGLVLLSIAWALRLGTVAGMVAGTTFLIVALTYLQIRPEERALSAKFGDSYDQYKSRVRRWI